MFGSLSRSLGMWCSEGEEEGNNAERRVRQPGEVSSHNSCGQGGSSIGRNREQESRRAVVADSANEQ